MHPAIEARQPSGSKRIAHEHDEHLQSIAELRDEVAMLRAARPLHGAALALRLYRHLALFVAANFQHMHIEETAHNAALWAHYSDAELMQLHGRLLASIDPREHLLVARWMVPALTPAERAAIVRGMQTDAPPEAFLGLLAHIRPHLDDKAWTHPDCRARRSAWPPCSHGYQALSLDHPGHRRAGRSGRGLSLALEAHAIDHAGRPWRHAAITPPTQPTDT